MTEEEKQREKEEQDERRKFEEDRRRKRFHKYCLDGELMLSNCPEDGFEFLAWRQLIRLDLTVEYKADKDAAAGRIGLRPAPKTDLPFDNKFEQLLMTWSFLNVMGCVGSPLPGIARRWAYCPFSRSILTTQGTAPPLALVSRRI